MLALTASPAGELTVLDTVVKIEELLDRLGADLVAPVGDLEEVNKSNWAGGKRAPESKRGNPTALIRQQCVWWCKITFVVPNNAMGPGRDS